MSNAVWIGFIVVAGLSSAFFVFKKRQVDFLTIALAGSLFYFSPLFWGRVLQSSPDLDPTVPLPVYFIAITYLLALVFAGSFPSTPAATPKVGRSLAEWYLILAVAGLVGSLVVSKGAIINADKAQALRQIGYLYVLFQIATSLTCISAVVERNWWIATCGALLLIIDLLIGFRVYVVLTALTVALVMLARDGRIRLFTKIPTYGVAALVLIVGMLLVHTVRFAIFDRIAITENTQRIVRTQEMRGDILQYDKQSVPTAPRQATDSVITERLDESIDAVSRQAQSLIALLQRSEPSIIQATLAGIVERNVSCNPFNIFKSLYLLLPPGSARFFPSTFPPTFYDEYQPILYPGITYGTGGNIWAEMLCRFGYAGVAIFGFLLILTLMGLYRILLRSSTATAPPIAFGGIIIAFYIGRNDLHYTLVMLREIAFVLAAAYGLSWLRDKLVRRRVAA